MHDKVPVLLFYIFSYFFIIIIIIRRRGRIFTTNMQVCLFSSLTMLIVLSLYFYSFCHLFFPPFLFLLSTFDPLFYPFVCFQSNRIPPALLTFARHLSPITPHACMLYHDAMQCNATAMQCRSIRFQSSWERDLLSRLNSPK